MAADPPTWRWTRPRGSGPTHEVAHVVVPRALLLGADGAHLVGPHLAAAAAIAVPASPGGVVPRLDLDDVRRAGFELLDLVLKVLRLAGCRGGGAAGGATARLGMQPSSTLAVRSMSRTSAHVHGCGCGSVWDCGCCYSLAAGLAVCGPDRTAPLLLPLAAPPRGRRPPRGVEGALPGRPCSRKPLPCAASEGSPPAAGQASPNKPTQANYMTDLTACGPSWQATGDYCYFEVPVLTAALTECESHRHSASCVLYKRTVRHTSAS